MWLTAPLSVPLGYLFRWCKILGKRKEEWRSDGILGSEELAEFIRLHQVDAGLGGKLAVKVGTLVRDVINGEVGTIGETIGWNLLFKVDEDQEVDAPLLARICQAICPFIMVGSSVHGNGALTGVLLRKV